MPVSQKKQMQRRLIAILGFGVFILIQKYSNLTVTLVIVFTLVAIVLFNLVVKNFISFKPYFMSRYNIFTFKTRKCDEFELSKDIVFDKLLEVLPIAGFKLEESNFQSGSIFAINNMSTKSNGENLYIKIEEKENNTLVYFNSANFGVASSSASKEDAYKAIMLEFEKSLTI